MERMPVSKVARWPKTVGKLALLYACCFVLFATLSFGICHAYFSANVSVTGNFVAGSLIIEYRNAEDVAGDDLYINKLDENGDLIYDEYTDEVVTLTTGSKIMPGDRLLVTGTIENKGAIDAYVILESRLALMTEADTTVEEKVQETKFYNLLGEEITYSLDNKYYSTPSSLLATDEFVTLGKEADDIELVYTIDPTITSELSGRTFKLTISVHAIQTQNLEKDDKFNFPTDETSDDYQTLTSQAFAVQATNMLIGDVSIPVTTGRIYGNSVQRNLPEEYQQVEYIESTGTQYIELNYIASSATSVKGKYQITERTPSMLFGSRTSSTSRFYGFNWGGASANPAYYNAYYSATITNKVTDTEYHTFYKNKEKLYIDDTLISTHTNTSSFTTPYNMVVFGCNTNGTIGVFSLAKIFYLQFYDEDVLKVDLVPCYRKSDNEIGLYDLVNNVFYSNNGTGTFAKGNNAPTPEAPIEVQSVGEKTNNLLPNKSFYSSGNVFLGITKLAEYFTLEAGTYTFSVKPINNIVVNVYILKEDNSTLAVKYSQNYVTFTLTETTNIKVKAYHSSLTSVNDILEAQITLGDAVKDYEPYGYKIPIRVGPINYFSIKDNNASSTTFGYQVTNGVIYRENIYGGYLETSWLVQKTVFESLIGTLELEKGTYIWDITNVSGKAITNPYIQLTLASGETTNWNAGTIITLTQNATITQIRSDLISYKAGDTQEFEIVIQQNDTLVEYQNTVIYLDQPLRKVGNYADYIDFSTGKVVRKVKEISLSSLSWTFNSSSNVFAAKIEDGISRTEINTNASYCSHYPLFVGGFGNMPDKSFQNPSNYWSAYNYVVVRDSDYTDSTSFKNYLTANNVMLHYILATPMEDAIDIPEISVMANLTEFTFETTIQPSDYCFG